MNFNGRPVLDFPPHFDGVQHGVDDDLSLKPFGIGGAIPWKPTTHTRRTLTLPFQFGSRTEWRAFRDFVAARKGRVEGFWLPIYLTDYPTFQQDTGTDTIVMKPIGFFDIFGVGMDDTKQYNYLALIRPGLIEPHEIIGAGTTGDTEILTLDGNIVGNFPVESSVVCALLYVRFDDEAIAYEFVSDGVVRATVRFIELPQEYRDVAAWEFPVYLFVIDRGNSQWRFTNYGKSLVIDGELWTHAPIGMSETKSTTDFISEQQTITVATDEITHPMLFHILNRRAFERTDITVFRVDASDGTIDFSQPFYVGKVGPCQTGANGTIELTCTSNLQIGERNAPHIQNMRFCNLTTGDVNCQVVLDDFTTTANISGLSSDDPPYIEAVEFGAKATAESDPNWFALGMVTIGNERRMCTGQNGNRLYLDFGFYKAVLGDQASAIAGDDKRAATCDEKFNNLRRYRGFTYTPNRNPNLTPFLNPNPEGGKK